MRAAVPMTTLGDLLYNAEQLYTETKDAGLLQEASSMYEVVRGLRDRVREERETT